MRKMRLVNCNTNASASVYTALISLFVVAALLTVYFVSVDQITVPFESSESIAYNQALQLSESLICDSGMDETSSNWENNPQDVKKLGIKANSPIAGILIDENLNFSLNYFSSYFSQFSRDKFLFKKDRGGSSPEDDSCFLEGTKVLMANGSYKNIEYVEIGDNVKALDLNTGKIVDSKVTYVFHHSPEEMTDYYMVINDNLRVTPNHPFYHEEKAWIYAEDFRIGDKIGIPGNQFIISSIEKVYKKVPTFNFEVAEHHNYIVSLDNKKTVVHNDDAVNPSDSRLALASMEKELEMEVISGHWEQVTCFLEGTKVLMADGSYKNIEYIEIGDEVKSFDESSGELKDDGVVSYVFRHSPEEMTDYYMVINDFLRVTPNHLMYVDGEWVEAGDLSVGDFLGVGSSRCRVDSVECVFERVPTFNFEVEPYHNYVVANSEEDILVHNEAGSYAAKETTWEWVEDDDDDDDDSCFLEGTKVLMADGSYKNIEDIEIGDNVTSFNTIEKIRTNGIVSYVFRHSPEEMTDYYMVINDFLRVTPNHPMMVDGEWVEAGDLSVGDFLGVGSSRCRVDSVECVFERVPTFNFEVEPYHNYVVANSEEDILVHNLIALIEDDGVKGGTGDSGGSCFTAGTLISMKDGQAKPIEEIKKGDKVLSYNLDYKEFEYKKVIATMSPYHKDIVEFVFSNDVSTKHTYDHPYYVIDKGWSSYKPDLTKQRYNIDTREIKIGDVVFTDEGKKIVLTEIKQVDMGLTKTYNFLVEDNHNYFADGILVHNKANTLNAIGSETGDKSPLYAMASDGAEITTINGTVTYPGYYFLGKTFSESKTNIPRSNYIFNLRPQDLISYGLIDKNKLDAFTIDDISYDKMLEATGLDIPEIKYRSNIYIEILDYQTSEIIWSYSDIDESDSYSLKTIFSRTLPMTDITSDIALIRPVIMNVKISTL